MLNKKDKDISKKPPNKDRQSKQSNKSGSAPSTSKLKVDTKKVERTSKMSRLTFYLKLAHASLTKGSIEYFDNIDVDKIGVGSGSIVSDNTIKWYYVITAFPGEISDSYFNHVRRQITGFSNDTGVEVNFIVDASPYIFNPDSYAVKSKIRQWKERYDSTMSRQGSMSRTDQLFVDKNVKENRDKDQRMIESYEIIERSQYEKRSLFKFTFIIELSISLSSLNSSDLPINANRKQKVRLAQAKLSEAEKSMKFMFSGDGVKCKKVYGFMLEFIKRFAITSMKKNTLSSDMYPTQIANDSILSRFATYTQGVFNTAGQYLGNDKISNVPIFYNFIQKNKAQNILIAAKTGGGKSFFVKMLLFYFLVFKCRLIINDYEGDEYFWFGKFVGAHFIDMKGTESVYVDTSIIGDLTGDTEIDKTLYEESVNTTEIIFDALIDCDNGMSSTQRAIFSRAFKTVYNELGVVEKDSATWSNSKGCTYQRVYDKAKELSTDQAMLKLYGREIVNFVNILSVYFDKEIGTKTNMFENRITVDNLKSNRVNIFSFGNKGGSSQTISKTDIAVRQIYVAYISNSLSNYNKTVLNTNTVQAYEEGQRYGEQKGSAEILANVFTGARKRNVIGMFITNSPNKLIQYGGMFTDLLDNTTSLILGELESNTAKSLCDYYEIPFAEKYLAMIKNNVKFEYSFLLCLDRKYYAVSSMMVPRQLAEHKIFKTKEDTPNAEKTMGA